MKFETGLGELIGRGGIYHAMPGNSVQETLECIIAKIPLPKTITPQMLLKAMLEREALMSTGVGSGIAIPHPRNPLISEAAEQFVALAYLEKPLDWRALDGKPVDTLFILVSATAKFHLQTLSALTYLCRQDEFLGLLGKKVSGETLIQYINETEEKW